jgi:Fe-S cluster biogenesis protein NfuA
MLVDHAALPRPGPSGEGVVVHDDPGDGAHRALPVFGVVLLEALALGSFRDAPEEGAEHPERHDHEQRLVPATLMGEHHALTLPWELGAVGACCTLVPEQPPGRSMRDEVMKAIEVIRPALQADGGDMIVRSIDEETGRIEVELVGACGTCPASTMTMKAGIERILKDRVEGVTEVVAV